MRLLLDENLPKRLKTDFSDHEIYTVRDTCLHKRFGRCATHQQFKDKLLN